MVSKADTLIIAEAEMLTARQKINDARRGNSIGVPSPVVLVDQTIRLMEQTIRRLRKSFKQAGV